MANTARSSNLGFVAWEAEDSFADAADDSYTTVIQIRDDMIDVSGLEQDLMDPGGTYQRLNEHDFYRLPAFGVGTFSITVDLGAHGSTCSGALTETNLAKLLAQVFGNSDWTQVGDSSMGIGTDADTLGVADGALLAGGLVRVGAVNDGRCNGQALAVASGGSAAAVELLTGATATNAAADVLYAMGMIYPVSATGQGDVLTSDGSTSSNTLRFNLVTPNYAYICRGCACTAAALSGLNPGENPQLQLTFSTVAWNPTTVTFPSATSIDDKASSVCADGSVFIQNAGTTTRATVAPMEIAITLGHALVERNGPGGENTRQNVVGWHRVPAETTISLTVEAEAQTASPAFWLTSAQSTAKHILVTCNTVDGKSVAFYFPRCIQTKNPTMGDAGGLRSQTVEYRAATNTTTTNELTLSAWRMGLG